MRAKSRISSRVRPNPLPPLHFNPTPGFAMLGDGSPAGRIATIVKISMAWGHRAAGRGVSVASLPHRPTTRHIKPGGYCFRPRLAACLHSVRSRIACASQEDGHLGNTSQLWGPGAKAALSPWNDRIQTAENAVELLLVLSELAASPTPADGQAADTAGTGAAVSLPGMVPARTTATQPTGAVPQGADLASSHDSEGLDPMGQTPIASPQPPHLTPLTPFPTPVTPLLTPLMLSTCLQRLADYHLSDPEIFKNYQILTPTSLPGFHSVLSMLQQQFAFLCRIAQPDGAQEVPPSYRMSLHCLVACLWSLAMLLDPLPEQDALPDGVTFQATTAQAAYERIMGQGGPEERQLLVEVLEGAAAWADARQVDIDYWLASTSDLTALMCAYASLLGLARERGADCKASAALVDGISLQLAHALQKLVTGNEMQARDLADVACALVTLNHRSSAVARLAEAMAHEVYRQISNRNSLNTPFRPRDLVRLLRAYAQLDVKDAKVPRMLDAIAGYTVKRIRAQHEVAIRHPADIADLLHAYADLNHVSVAIPELVSSTARQLTSELAAHQLAVTHQQQQEQQEQQRLKRFASAASSSRRSTLDAQGNATLDTATATTTLDPTLDPTATLDQGQMMLSGTWREYLPPERVLLLLDGYRRLGFYPGQSLMAALLVPLSCQVDQASSATLSGLLQAWCDLRHDPGPALCTSLARTLHTRWLQGHASAHRLATALVACAALNYPPSPDMVEDACRACLYLDETNSELEGAGGDSEGPQGPLTQPRQQPTTTTTHRFLTQPPSPELACQLLFALVVCDSVTIRRFGMACVALRGNLGQKTLGQQGLGLGQQGLGLASQGLNLGPQGLPDEALVAVATAALMLGEEGWEMAEEVLPESVVARLRRTLRDSVTSWAGDLQGSPALSDLHAIITSSLPSLGATKVSGPSLEVLGCTLPLPLFKTILPSPQHIAPTTATASAGDSLSRPLSPPVTPLSNHPHGQAQDTNKAPAATTSTGTSTRTPAPTSSPASASAGATRLVAVEPLLAGDVATNSPHRPLGTATFRWRLVQRLWQDSLEGGQDQNRQRQVRQDLDDNQQRDTVDSTSGKVHQQGGRTAMALGRERFVSEEAAAVHSRHGTQTLEAPSRYEERSQGQGPETPMGHRAESGLGYRPGAGEGSSRSGYEQQGVVVVVQVSWAQFKMMTTEERVQYLRAQLS